MMAAFNVRMAEEQDKPAIAVAVQAPRRRYRFVVLWQKIGMGSLGFSLLFHAAILLFMASYFIARQMVDKQVDFLPGGGTQQGAQASADLAEKMQVKQRQKISKVLPLQRVAVENAHRDQGTGQGGLRQQSRALLWLRPHAGIDQEQGARQAASHRG